MESELHPERPQLWQLRYGAAERPWHRTSVARCPLCRSSDPGDSLGDTTQGSASEDMTGPALLKIREKPVNTEEENLNTVVHGCHLSTEEVEAEASGVRGHLLQFKNSLV